MHDCRSVLLLLMLIHFFTFGRRRSKAEPSRAYVLPPNRAIGLYPLRCTKGFPSLAPASSSRCGKTWNITTCNRGCSRFRIRITTRRGGHVFYQVGAVGLVSACAGVLVLRTATTYLHSGYVLVSYSCVVRFLALVLLLRLAR